MPWECKRVTFLAKFLRKLRKLMVEECVLFWVGRRCPHIFIIYSIFIHKCRKNKWWSFPKRGCTESDELMTFKGTFLKFSSIWNLLEFLRFRKHKQRILLGRGGEEKKNSPFTSLPFYQKYAFQNCPQNFPLLQSLPRKLSWKLGANCGSLLCTWVLTQHFEATWRGLGLSKATCNDARLDL